MAFITDINGKTYELGSVYAGQYAAGALFYKPLTIGSPIISKNNPFWTSTNREFKFYVSSGNYINAHKYSASFLGKTYYYMQYELYINNEKKYNGNTIYSDAGLLIKGYDKFPGCDVYIAIKDGLGKGKYTIYSLSGGTPAVGTEYRKEYLFKTEDITKEDFNNFISQAPNPGGNSGTGGGDGNFDDSSDNINFPENPAFSAVDGAMVSMFSPNLYELNQLAAFLWTDTFYEGFVKIWGDPMDLILSLNITYATPTLEDSYNLKIGMFDTGVSMKRVVSQYVRIDCGSLSLNEYWGNSLDYTPYTKCSIYLPFIGTQTLDVDQVMNANISVFYNVDLLTGACICFIKISKGNLNSVIYNFPGNVSTQIPLTGSNMAQLQNTLLSAIASAGKIAVGASTGSMASVAIGSAMNIISGKREVSLSGRLDSSIGQMSYKTPYLIITRPAQSLPSEYNKFKGYPTNITETLSNLSGYTEIESVHLENIKATQPELNMIEELLKSGVIL